MTLKNKYLSEIEKSPIFVSLMKYFCSLMTNHVLQMNFLITILYAFLNLTKENKNTCMVYKDSNSTYPIISNLWHPRLSQLPADAVYSVL